MSKNLIVVFMLIITAMNCTSKKNNLLFRDKIYPDFCRVILSVSEIDSTTTSKNPNDPCSKAPCFAIVRVDSILGYGSSFGTTFSVNENIMVKFVYTTDKTTEKILPNFPKSYDGIKIGSKVLTEIKSRSKINSDSPELLIYGYEIITK